MTKRSAKVFSPYYRYTRGDMLMLTYTTRKRCRTLGGWKQLPMTTTTTTKWMTRTRTTTAYLQKSKIQV